MCKKKVLILNNNLHIGGVQKALVNLLWSLPQDSDVTLLLFSKTGAYLKEIPPSVRVLETRSHFRYLGLTRVDRLCLPDKLMRAFYAGVTRILGRSGAVALMGLTQKKLGYFDLAVSYLHNSTDTSFYGGCNEFLLNHVEAAEKVTVLHCDFGLCGADTPRNRAQYARFDRIAACSQGCADAFVRCCPELADKVTVVPNCHRFDEIRRMAAEAPVSPVPGKINLVTVARFGREKGVERALRVLARLGERKNQVHYWIIGDGIRKPEILELIQKENLGETVTLCGMLENPYGYVQAADLMLIPSYSEAAPLVIGESACLGTPILSMATSSAEEMIARTGFGWVCENDEEAMAVALEALLCSPEMLAEAGGRLARLSLDNDGALKQFQSL